MGYRHLALAALASLALSAGPTGALAQGSGQAAPVNVYQYAIDHPVEDTRLDRSPSLGASVPATVQVATVADGDTVYGYFYYGGRPIIVEMRTRSVVRIDD